MATYVARSRIDGAGGGLFAGRAYRRGEAIGRYRGVAVTGAQIATHAVVRGYILRVGGGYVDASDLRGRLRLQDGRLVDTNAYGPREWAALDQRGVEWVGAASIERFANHSTAPNAVFRGSALRAKRPIAPGEEIVVNYGPAFFKDAHSDACARCSRPGALICCDVCWRAWHAKCAAEPRRANLPAIWVCPACRR